MKYLNSDTNFDKRLIAVMLTPSWLSAGIAVIAGIVVSIGTLLSSHYRSSSFRVDLINFDITHTSAYSYFDSTTSSGFISNLPLFMFWILVGLVVYMLAISIIKAIRTQIELNEETGFVNADKSKLIRTSVEHFLVRLVVLLVWTGYILFFFRTILPYCGASALAGSGQTNFFLSAMYLLLSMGVMIVAMHIHTVLFRLLVLKPRVFSKALYVD